MAQEQLKVILTGDATRLSASLKTASGKLQAFGSRVKSIGASMRSFTIPLAIAGGAAGKMAYDFDKSMTQIKSLVGIASDEVDKMGESVKEMSKSTGVSSNEAADALFFITSAGLKGSEAMDVLNASMKAAAVGLGETKTVADLATSAMNAYGSDVISATDATDVMVAAVREGKLEASELAGSMGRVLPVASAMGVSFNEVGAAFAALSRTGTQAAEAATQIRGILTSLLKPGTQAEQMLKQMGLSSQGLRKTIKEDGLLATLEILKEKFEGNDMAAQTVFGNVRALSGVMDLLGSNIGSTRDIFDKLGDSVGDTGKAFDIYSQSQSAQMRDAINELKTAFLEIGQVLLKTLLPYIKDLAAWIKKAAEKFDSWSEASKETTVKLGALLVIMPSVLSVLGTLITVAGNVSRAFVALNGAKALGGFKSLITKLPPQIAIFAAALAGLAAIQESTTKDLAPSLDFWERWKISMSSWTFKQERDRLIEAEAAAKSLASTLEYVNSIKPIPTMQGVGMTPLSGMGLLTFGQSNKPTKEDKSNANDWLTQLAEDLKDFELDQSILGAENILDDTDIAFQLAASEANIESFASRVGYIIDGIGEQWGDMGETLANNFAQVGASIAGSLADAAFNGSNFIDTLSQALIGLIKRLVVAAATAAILAAFTGGGSAAAGASGAAGAGKALTGLAKSTTAFANGGIVSTPTLGLVGEYAGARSNPEVIAPLDKLKSMLGDRPGGNVHVTGEFGIRGNDLAVVLDRANNTRNRLG